METLFEPKPVMSKDSVTTECMNERVSRLVQDAKAKQYEMFASQWRDRVDPTLLPQLYRSAVGAFQSKRAGVQLEMLIGDHLRSNGFSVYYQVGFKNGVYTKHTEGADVVDIAIGPEPVEGAPVGDYIILSSKITSRERKKLDNWTLKTPPRAFYFLTASNDYGNPIHFAESPTRKIVTNTPRRNDTRLYKLSFRDLVTDLRATISAT